MAAAKKTDPVKAADAVHAKREDFDNPPVDAPVPVVDTIGEVEGNGPNLEVKVDGTTATVTLGKESTVLDGEGVKAAKRHFDKAAAVL